MASKEFERERLRNVAALRADGEARELSLDWMRRTAPHKYSYNFSWLGRPIIQYPQDLVAMQEIVWTVQPDLIIETGIAHGGSLVFYASLLELLRGNGLVVGVDVDIRAHNREGLDAHFLRDRMVLIEGSSTDAEVVDQVRAHAASRERVLVVLDSNHTHEHVLAELRAYSPLVTKGSYLVVFDTVVEDFPDDAFPDRPWGPGDNPATAVREFLGQTQRFQVDADIDARLQISVAPGGYLRCISA